MIHSHVKFKLVNKSQIIVAKDAEAMEAAVLASGIYCVAVLLPELSTEATTPDRPDRLERFERSAFKFFALVLVAALYPLLVLLVFEIPVN